MAAAAPLHYRHDVAGLAPGARRGYTLVEILMVVIIFGVLTTIAILNLGPALQHARVRGAANELATDLQYAQLLAVRERTPMLLTVDASTRSYEITDRQQDTVYRTREFGDSSDYLLDELSASPSAVELFPNGVAGTNATFTLGINGFRRQVSLTRAGQIRITNVP